MADIDQIRVFKDHENLYWLDSVGKMRFPKNSKVYCNDTLYPGQFFANQELTVEYVLEWLPRTTELYSRRELGKPNFYDQEIPRIAPTQPAQTASAFQPIESPLPPTALPCTPTLPTLNRPTPAALPSTTTTPTLPSPLTSQYGHIVLPEPSASATTDLQGIDELEEADGFTKNETKFFIDLMRQHILKTSNKLPSSIAELQDRINLGKGKRKLMWQDFSEKMAAAFGKKFAPEKLQRKWKGLQDSFKKAKANNEASGRAPSRFQFYEEMRDLIGSQHDIDFPITATAKSIVIHRPEEIERLEVDDPEVEESAVPGGPSTEPVAGPSSVESRTPVRRQRKRQKDMDIEMFSFLKESDQRHTEIFRGILEQMKKTEETTASLLSQILSSLK